LVPRASGGKRRGHFVEFQGEPGRRLDAETMSSPGEWNPLLRFYWTIIIEDVEQDLRVFMARDNPHP
jgi:hypothetical protein